MADSTTDGQPEITAKGGEVKAEKKERLKYLDFVQVAMLHAVVCVSSLYGFAKENAGPLKPGVQTVEGTVKNVVGPVYERLHDVPFRLLKFVDSKVDDVVVELHRRMPNLVKRAPGVARSVAGDVQRSGIIPTATNAARCAYDQYGPVAVDLYNQYEPVAEKYAVAMWRSLNRLPVFPQVARLVVPTAAHWSDKYNDAVRRAVDRGYTVAEYVPLIPTERIAKVFGNSKASKME